MNKRRICIFALLAVLLVGICFFFAKTPFVDLSLEISQVEAERAQGIITLTPKWGAKILSVDKAFDSSGLFIPDPDNPLQFTFDGVGIDDLYIDYTIFGIERHYRIEGHIEVHQQWPPYIFASHFYQFDEHGRQIQTLHLS